MGRFPRKAVKGDVEKNTTTNKGLIRLNKHIVMIGLTSLLAFLLSACGGGSETTSGTPASGDKQQTLVVVDWGGAITEARKKPFFEPFEKKYNVKIQVESPSDYGKFKAMVDSSNVTWDVVNVDTFFVYQAAKQNLLEPLDYSVIKKDDITPELVHEYGIGAELFTTTMAYNPTKYPNGTHPQTWADFWDTTKFPGPRGLYKSSLDTLEMALMADGVAPDKLYPLDVDRAFKKLNELKPQIKVWWDAGAQPPQLLANGDVALSNAWHGRITAAKKQGVPVDQEFNQGILASESWVVPKGSKNKDLAMKFIAFVSEAEPQAEFAKISDYTPVNKKAIELLPQDVKERLGQTPEMAKKQILVDNAWWAENYEAVNQRFMEWLLVK
ncbi:UNVERIFIED_CONTAM: putative spermidine/putrescine transport system substrate-binding protein [Brevibacillus sp. OAP136]